MGDICLVCGGTGLKVDGTVCDCGCLTHELNLPTSIKIPLQYQGVRYDRSFLKSGLRGTLGLFMERLLEDCIKNMQVFCKNYVICAAPNSGKTVWAYSLYSEMYSRGLEVVDLMDLMEVREAMLNYYYEDRDKVILISTVKYLVIKLPLDLPNKFPETMSTVLERRVRNSGSTFFLFSGTKEDLLQQDRFGKLKSMIGDGAFNTVDVVAFQ